MFFQLPRLVAAILIFIVILLSYIYATIRVPGMNLYNYILAPLMGSGFSLSLEFLESIGWYIAFAILIYTIQFTILYTYSIKNIPRDFDSQSMITCIMLSLMCNLLMSMDILAKSIVPTFQFDKLKNPLVSTGVMTFIFIITYILIWVLRSILRIVS